VIGARVQRLLRTFLVAAVLGAPASGWAQGTPSPHDSTQALVKRDILTLRSTQISAYPYAYYTPETELAFGVGGIVTFYTSKEDAILRPSKVTLSGYYTTKTQYKFTGAPVLYFGRNKTIVTGNIDYGFYVDKFWGVGNETPDLDNPEFESKGFGVEASLQVPPALEFFNRTSTGVIYDLYNSDVTDKRTNPELTSGDVRGSDGGISSGLGLSWNWDTRDHVFYPTHGVYSWIKAVYYGQWLGGSFDFNRYEVDLRQYNQLKPNQILAFEAYVQSAYGSPPFYELPAMGGQRIMRGYYQGRYRDQVLFATQAEYRFHLKGRFGAVAFAGVGDVGSRLVDVRIRDLKTSLGGGLRFKFNQVENVNLRMDVGFGRNTSGVNFGLEEAF
jgi:outer membrane protein assembly factor BamA